MVCRWEIHILFGEFSQESHGLVDYSHTCKRKTQYVRQSQVRRLTASPNSPYDHFGPNRTDRGLTQKTGCQGLMIGG